MVVSGEVEIVLATAEVGCWFSPFAIRITRGMFTMLKSLPGLYRDSVQSNLGRTQDSVFLSELN